MRDYILTQLDRRERKIDVLVITHPDQDHYNLISEVLRDVPVGHVFRVGEMADYNGDFNDWLNAIPSHKVTVLQSSNFDPMDAPNSILECGDSQIWILAVATEATKSWKNAMSIVLMIRYGDFETILTGDATFDTENVIMGRYPHDWLDVDVLKVGHHGSRTTSTSAEWAEVVKPKVAIVSAGYRNRHGHPLIEVVERLDDYTENRDPHPMSYAKGKRNNYKWIDIENY